MTATGNPFEAPRTTDLDAGATAGGTLAVSDDALRELVAAAPWVRRLTRLTALAFAIETFAVALRLARPLRSATSWYSLLVNGAQAVVSLLFLMILRRYATASKRLRD